MQIYNKPYDVITTESQWWFLYGDDKIIQVEPQQCDGRTSSRLLTMVVADTFEECEAYIAENELMYLTQSDESILI